MRKPILGFEGYSATDDGVIWSRWRLNGRGGRFGNERYLSRVWRPLKPKDSQGRLTVVLYRGGTKSTRTVHRLVLEAFVGARPEDMECCHEDGDYRNNRIGNLRWDTHRSNVQDQIRHGTFKRITDAAAEANRGKVRPAEVKVKISASSKGKPKNHGDAVKRGWETRRRKMKALGITRTNVPLPGIIHATTS